LSAPSPGWRPRALRPLFWRDLLLVVEIVVDAVQRALTPRFDAILKEIQIMGQQTDVLVHDLVNKAEQPPADPGDGSAPVENPPAEGGDGSAPVE
jgi:hypothetical protein